MFKQLYFEGTQIKNYLIGFGSLFADIPFKDRNGKISVVPIRYGSPSDAIEFINKYVDQEKAQNVNRYKDIVLPLFSYRLVNIDRRPDKRRDPFSEFTVDLRKFGYATGYVAMRPSPVNISMELSLWASSDSECFEILEQIIPYFNSPQQVTIQPLPGCPVSTTEISMASSELNTDPADQKFGAQATLMFDVGGWLLAHPKIWSTNMAFEMQLLDSSDFSFDGYNPINFGNEISDLEHMNVIKENDPLLENLSVFILESPVIRPQFGLQYIIYDFLKTNSYIDSLDVITFVDPVLFTNTTAYFTDIKELSITVDKAKNVIRDVKEIQKLYENELLRVYIGNMRTLGDITNVLEEIMLKDSLSVMVNYFKTLEKGLTDINFSTDFIINREDKLKLYNSIRYDIYDDLNGLLLYSSVLTMVYSNIDRFANLGIAVDSAKYIFNNKNMFSILLITVSLYNYFLTITDLENDTLYKNVKKYFNIDIVEMAEIYSNYVLLVEAFKASTIEIKNTLLSNILPIY